MPKKWRILRDRCNRRWYYVREQESLYGTPSLKGEPLEFESQHDAIAYAESLYQRFKIWWRTWAELSVIIESPEGARSKHWLEPPEVIATVQRKDPY
jgi:hypothetical protein